MPLVVDLPDLDRSHVPLVGGKAAHLAELAKIEGVAVPPAFCVTTEAFKLGCAAALDTTGAVGDALHLAAVLRRRILDAPLPDALVAALVDALDRLGGDAFAVRSSATAEDDPGTSFAGMHDSWLRVPPVEVLRHIQRTWASLHSERAAAYRARRGIDPRGAQMAVLVQRMAPADASGVLFTADPVSGDRTIVTVEAVRGLGESMVSGRAHPARVKLRGEVVLERTANPPGDEVLSDAQALELARLGRRVEAHFGLPQDIEWCISAAGVRLVQSRPITTLFPVPPGDARRVYLSVGHQQMMTAAMKPLGLSLFQRTALRPMVAAGGRLFVDVTAALAEPPSRDALLAMAGGSDPLVRDALETLVARGFVPAVDAPGRPRPPPAADPDAADVAALVRRTEASITAMEAAISPLRGPELLEFIREDLGELKALLLDPKGARAVFAAMEAAAWLDAEAERRLGEVQVSHALSQAAPGNVTAEMGLALLDVADAIRPHPAVVAHLEAGGALASLDALPGGPAARAAFDAWLARYGMRCVGEIDVTRPRWSEHPEALVPLILGHVRDQPAGEARRRVDAGRRVAEATARSLLERLRALPEGDALAAEAERRIRTLRALVGWREFPKYGLIRRYGIYREALRREAARLVDAGVLERVDDIDWLSFDELAEVVRTAHVDRDLLARRVDEHRRHQTLSPPRVLTSDGEALNGAWRRTLPPRALPGLAVSAGVVEGRARVVLDLAGATLEPGEILVTPHTDPSWTPLFVRAAGLVTEVGGRMTHGAVIAREYGLPAVVAVDGATRLIADGQRVRVHGSDGYVELLDGPPPRTDPAAARAPQRT